MGFGKCHLFSGCGVMKFSIISLLLLLLFDRPQGLSSPHNRCIRSLNTTLQTNFNGTYERRNPLTNAEIETTSYSASHEFHHHSEEDTWSDYSHKCSAIISGFLQAIANLVQFNNNQNGIFNFHINTSISQKQNGRCDFNKQKSCDSLPTIIIEATGEEISPRSSTENPSKTEQSWERKYSISGQLSDGESIIEDLLTVTPPLTQDSEISTSASKRENIFYSNEYPTTPQCQTISTSLKDNPLRCPSEFVKQNFEKEQILQNGDNLSTLDGVWPTTQTSKSVPPQVTRNAEPDETSPAVFNLPLNKPLTSEPEQNPDFYGSTSKPAFNPNVPNAITLQPENQFTTVRFPTAYEPLSINSIQVPSVSGVKYPEKLEPLNPISSSPIPFNEETEFNIPRATPSEPFYYSTQDFNQTPKTVNNDEQIIQNKYQPFLAGSEEQQTLLSRQPFYDNLGGRVPENMQSANSFTPVDDIPIVLPPSQADMPSKDPNPVEKPLSFPDKIPQNFVGSTISPLPEEFYQSSIPSDLSSLSLPTQSANVILSNSTIQNQAITSTRVRPDYDVLSDRSFVTNPSPTEEGFFINSRPTIHYGQQTPALEFPTVYPVPSAVTLPKIIPTDYETNGRFVPTESLVLDQKTTKVIDVTESGFTDIPFPSNTGTQPKPTTLYDNRPTTLKPWQQFPTKETVSFLTPESQPNPNSYNNEPNVLNINEKFLKTPIESTKVAKTPELISPTFSDFYITPKTDLPHSGPAFDTDNPFVSSTFETVTTSKTQPPLSLIISDFPTPKPELSDTTTERSIENFEIAKNALTSATLPMPTQFQTTPGPEFLTSVEYANETRAEELNDSVFNSQNIPNALYQPQITSIPSFSLFPSSPSPEQQPIGGYEIPTTPSTSPQTFEDETMSPIGPQYQPPLGSLDFNNKQILFTGVSPEPQPSSSPPLGRFPSTPSPEQQPIGGYEIPESSPSTTVYEGATMTAPRPEYPPSLNYANHYADDEKTGIFPSSIINRQSPIGFVNPTSQPTVAPQASFSVDQNLDGSLVQPSLSEDSRMPVQQSDLYSSTGPNKYQTMQPIQFLSNDKMVTEIPSAKTVSDETSFSFTTPSQYPTYVAGTYTESPNSFLPGSSPNSDSLLYHQIAEGPSTVGPYTLGEDSSLAKQRGFPSRPFLQDENEKLPGGQPLPNIESGNTGHSPDEREITNPEQTLDPGAQQFSNESFQSAAPVVSPNLETTEMFKNPSTLSSPESLPSSEEPSSYETVSPASDPTIYDNSATTSPTPLVMSNNGPFAQDPKQFTEYPDGGFTSPQNPTLFERTSYKAPSHQTITPVYNQDPYYSAQAEFTESSAFLPERTTFAPQSEPQGQEVTPTEQLYSYGLRQGVPDHAKTIQQPLVVNPMNYQPGSDIKASITYQPSSVPKVQIPELRSLGTGTTTFRAGPQPNEYNKSIISTEYQPITGPAAVAEGPQYLNEMTTFNSSPENSITSPQLTIPKFTPGEPSADSVVTDRPPYSIETQTDTYRQTLSTSELESHSMISTGGTDQLLPSTILPSYSSEQTIPSGFQYNPNQQQLKSDDSLSDPYNPVNGQFPNLTVSSKSAPTYSEEPVAFIDYPSIPPKPTLLSQLSPNLHTEVPTSDRNSENEQPLNTFEARQNNGPQPNGVFIGSPKYSPETNAPTREYQDLSSSQGANIPLSYSEEIPPAATKSSLAQDIPTSLDHTTEIPDYKTTDGQDQTSYNFDNSSSFQSEALPANGSFSMTTLQPTYKNIPDTVNIRPDFPFPEAQTEFGPTPAMNYQPSALFTEQPLVELYGETVPTTPQITELQSVDYTKQPGEYNKPEPELPPNSQGKLNEYQPTPEVYSESNINGNIGRPESDSFVSFPPSFQQATPSYISPQNPQFEAYSDGNRGLPYGAMSSYQKEVPTIAAERQTTELPHFGPSSSIFGPLTSNSDGEPKIPQEFPVTDLPLTHLPDENDCHRLEVSPQDMTTLQPYSPEISYYPDQLNGYNARNHPDRQLPFDSTITPQYLENTNNQKVESPSPIYATERPKLDQQQTVLENPVSPNLADYNQDFSTRPPKLTEYGETTANITPGDPLLADRQFVTEVPNDQQIGITTQSETDSQLGFGFEKRSSLNNNLQTNMPPQQNQRSNPILQTVESQVPFPIFGPPRQIGALSNPEKVSLDPTVTSSMPFSFETRNQNGVSTVPPYYPEGDFKRNFVNSQAIVNTAQDVTSTPLFHSQPLVSDLTPTPSNKPGENYVSCCRNGSSPLLCPFDPVLKGNMTAPSYYILISKLPVVDDKDEHFQVEKVYLGDGTPLNCTLSAEKTFPKSLYTPIQINKADAVKLPIKSDFA